MSGSILLTYMTARGFAIPAVSTMGEGEIKDELYSSIHDDLLSGEHQEPCFKALDSAIQENIFLEEQFKTLFGIKRADKLTYLGLKIKRGRIDELKTFLDRALSVYPEALYFTDGDGWMGFHHLAECHPCLFLGYLPTHSESELRLLKLQTAEGTTVLEMFLIYADAAATEALFVRLDNDFKAEEIKGLFCTVNAFSKYAAIHWVAQKYPQMLPLLLRLLGTFAEEALALKSLRGNNPLNIAACFSPAELVDAAPEIVGVVPGAFLGAIDGRGCPLNYIARIPECYQYFFPLLRSLGADHRGLLMVRDAKGFTPLSRLADFAVPCLIAELKAGNITPDELLIQDANGVTPTHRLAFSAPDILMTLFDQLGDRLDELFRMEVPFEDRSYARDMAEVCRVAKVGDSTQGFVNAMLVKNEADFGTAIARINHEVLTSELKLRLMEKYIEFASDAVKSKVDIRGASRVELAHAAMAAISEGKKRFKSEFASHNTGLLAVIFKNFDLSLEPTPAPVPVLVSAPLPVLPFRGAGADTGLGIELMPTHGRG